MSIKRYEEYENTSVTWANKIPKHWELLPTKRAFRRKKETNAGMKVENRLALTMKGVLKRSLDDLDGLQASEYETYQIFQEGDLAFKLIDLQNIKTSRVGIVPEEGIMSPAYIRLEGTGRIEPKYAYWYFMKLYHECIFNELGGGVRQTIGPEELLSLPLTYPPKSEQYLIATFLDRETAKIDDLIAEQQRLIELLQEKRQAVISHAVTKGLNPNASMKDSGVEWLGEVPEHWAVQKASWLFRTEKGKKAQELTQEYCATNEGPFPVFSGQTKDGGVMGSIDSYEFDAGDAGAILCTTVGAKAMSIRRITGWFSLSQNCMVISPKTEEVTPVFFEYGFQPLFKHERALIPDHMQPSFRMEDFNQFWVQLPPVEEQAKISKYLQQENDVSVELEAEISAAIDLLQERRSALISAAVTGQIDVRGQATEEEP